MKLRAVAAVAAGALLVGAVAFVSSDSPAGADSPPAIAADTGVVYGAPVTITQGGTYTPTTTGVTVTTTQPVVIENCFVKATTRHLIYAGPGSNVTVRNCRLEGSTTPGNSGWRAVWAQNAATITVTGNDVTHIAAFKAVGGNPRITVTHNRVRDVIGDETNCCGGGYAPAFQLSNLISPSAVIAWNEVVNLPGRSNMEDAVNLFAASGTVTDPIRVHDNFVWGAYPLPVTDRYSGGGILTGDGGGGTNNVVVTNNQIVGAANYGIQIGGGNNVRFTQNRVVASGLTADGTAIPSMNTNPFWTYNAAPTNSSMSDNVWALMRPPGGFFEPNNQTWHRVDSWMPACGSNGNTCTGNTSLTADPRARILYSAEVAEWERWVVKSVGQPIGRSTTPTTTTTVPATTTVPPTTTTTVPTTTVPACVDLPALKVRVCPL